MKTAAMKLKYNTFLAKTHGDFAIAFSHRENSENIRLEVYREQSDTLTFAVFDLSEAESIRVQLTKAIEDMNSKKIRK